MQKKINSNFYSDQKQIYANGFDFEKIDGERYLFSNDVYPTKIKASDLPDSFIKITHWANYYYNMAGVKDILYVPSRLVGDNNLKYDTIYISYKGKIKYEKGENVRGTTAEIIKDDNTTRYINIKVDETSYDYALRASWDNEIFDKLVKYSPDLKDKITKFKSLRDERIKEIESYRERMFEE